MIDKNQYPSLSELQEKVVVSILENTTEHGAIAGKNPTRSFKYYNGDDRPTGTSTISVLETVQIERRIKEAQGRYALD